MKRKNGLDRIKQKLYLLPKNYQVLQSPILSFVTMRRQNSRANRRARRNETGHDGRCGRPQIMVTCKKVKRGVARVVHSSCNRSQRASERESPRRLCKLLWLNCRTPCRASVPSVHAVAVSVVAPWAFPGIWRVRATSRAAGRAGAWPSREADGWLGDASTDGLLRRDVRARLARRADGIRSGTWSFRATVSGATVAFSATLRALTGTSSRGNALCTT